MLQVVKLKLTDDEYVHKHYLSNLLKCFNFDYKNNSFKEKSASLEDLKNVLGNYIYLVFRMQKFIGFFITPIIQDRVDIKLFRNPDACPMSARALVKAAVLKGLKEGKDLEFSVWHPALTHVLKAIVPTFNTHMITSDYILCSYTYKEKDVSRALERYVEDVNESDFNILL